MKVREKAQGGDQPHIHTGYNPYPPCRWDSYKNLPYPPRWPSSDAFPEDLPQLRLVVEKLLIFLCQTTEFIESLISQSLGLPASFLKEFNGDRIEHFKVLCYPKARSQQEEIGASKHQDSSCITLVRQDES